MTENDKLQAVFLCVMLCFMMAAFVSALHFMLPFFASDCATQNWILYGGAAANGTVMCLIGYATKKHF
jgi:hypothetical protein